MAKPKLKLIEPSLQDQLEEAITVAASAHKALASAKAKFEKQYPEDHRLLMTDVLGTTQVDPERDAQDPNAKFQSKTVVFLQERKKVGDLQLYVQEADGAVELLRARIEAAVTEGERRVALAAAITEAGNADAAVQKLRAAVARVNGAVKDAQERHDDAAKAVTTASEAHARLFEAAIEQGHPPGRDSAVRDARRSFDDAADELAVAKNAVATIKTKLDDAERRLKEARAFVVACAQTVAASAIPRLLKEAQAMQSELEARRQVLSMLGDFDDTGAGFGMAVDEYLSASFDPSQSDHPAIEPWTAVIDQLSFDADAPLPR